MGHELSHEIFVLVFLRSDRGWLLVQDALRPVSVLGPKTRDEPFLLSESAIFFIHGTHGQPREPVISLTSLTSLGRPPVYF
jgi:hypothetical protein